MLGRSILRFGRQIICRGPLRRANTMPDPYRERYRPSMDPIIITGFFLVTVPLLWIAKDIALGVDQTPKRTE
ncbi:unnamed protein product [Dibothriocephalus latus]|uniref:Uncharacterized protein n=1 Tax=Dibothriocephalus latus TaxID=60516 RepID=A0A3P7MRE6_DIBLA|nr:unnamed protein product [Dibothriocephalus latus]